MNEPKEVVILKTPPEVVKIPVDGLMSSMSDVVREGLVPPGVLEDFLNKKCEGVRVGKTDVVFVEQEHILGVELDPSLESIARASGTKVIMVEYFEPELMANA